MITTEQYNQAYKDFQAGRITEEEWRKTVDLFYAQRMEECKDVFIRMKNK